MQKNKCLCLVLCILIIALAIYGCAETDETPDEQTLDFSSLENSTGANTPSAFTTDTNAIPSSASPSITADAPEDDDIISLQPKGNANGGMQVVSSVAYVLSDMLYGGVEFQNTGSSAMVLKEATFTFTYNGGNIEHAFEPVAWDRDVILPGDTGYCTLWLPYEGETPPDTVSLACTLLGEVTSASSNVLRVESARLIQNYPSFATLSGRLINFGQESYTLNMVYAGFYGQNGELLGVFHFTRNALLHPNDDIPFVIHLRRLPIPSLADLTTDIRFHAFSM